MEEFITIVAVDRDSSDTTSRSFMVDGIAPLKAMVEDWEKKNITFRKYYLTTPNVIEDFTQEVQDILEELEVTE